jgi:hypothetical protein
VPSPINHGSAEDSLTHPGALLALLADDVRLRIFSAIVVGAGTAEEAARMAGAPPKPASKAIERLIEGGVVVTDADGSLRAETSSLRKAARLAARMRLDPSPEDLGATPDQAAVLRGHLVMGRIASLPSQQSKRRVVLDFVAQQFEPGRRYPEPEVNAILARFNDDYAAFRRALVDGDLLERRDGIYWRSGGSFDVG